MTSVIHILPLEQRPKVFGCLGGLMATAQITGPLIGGGFTSHVSWRWCFYINLPIAGLALLAIFFFLDIPEPDTMKLPLAKKLRQLDIPGTGLVAPGAICLLLALQWGGQTYAVSYSYYIILALQPSTTDSLQWNNGRIIALLTLAGVLLIAFGASQALFPETATLPPHFFKNRSVLAAFCLFVAISCSNFIVSESDHISPIHPYLLTYRNYSLLPPDLVSGYNRRLCCRVRHPHHTSDGSHNCRDNFGWVFHI
jgi:MFS family permease